MCRSMGRSRSQSISTSTSAAGRVRTTRSALAWSETVAQRSADSRASAALLGYAFVDMQVEIDTQLPPRAEDPADLAAKAERDCFVGASLAIEPEYTWRVS